MSVEQHSLLVAALCLPALAALWFLVGWLRTRHTTGHSIKHHHEHYRILHHVSWVGLLGAVGLAVTGAGIAYVVYFHGGAKFQPNRHIPPHISLKGGGSGKPPNFGLYLPAPYQQNDTNSCWCQSTSAAFYAAEHQRGSLMPVPSPWRCFWYGAGGQNSTGTLDQAVAAYNSYGAEPFKYWPAMGPPDASDAGYTTAYRGLRVRYAYYGAGYGITAVRAIMQELDAGHVVVMLWQVNSGALQQGVWVQWNTGYHEFYHFSVIYGYLYNADGTVSFAVRNSWSENWGINGDALFPQSVIERDALAAGVIEPGAPVPASAWSPPAPPTPTPRPTPSSPTATARPTATTTPAPCHPVRLTLVHGANARAVPRLSAPALFGLSRGQHVTAVCPNGYGGSTHWVEVTDAQNRLGWVLRSALHAG